MVSENGTETETFRVLPEHLALLRAAHVRFDRSTHGVTIDPKRPYGNSDVEADMRRILGENGQGLSTEELHRLHAETATALEVCLRTELFTPGLAVRDRYRSNWRRA